MSGLSAFGTIFTLGSTGSTGVIGNLTGISGPGISADTIDVTSHDSTNGYRQFVAGVIDGGEVTLEGNLLTAGAGDEMLELAETRANVCFRVKFPTASGSTGWDWLFAGSLNSFETDAPFDDQVSFSAGVKLTGQPFMTSTYAT